MPATEMSAEVKSEAILGSAAFSISSFSKRATISIITQKGNCTAPCQKSVLNFVLVLLC